MDKLSRRELELHVPVVGWLFIIGHMLFLLLGAFVFILLTGIGVAIREPEATPILATVGMGVGVVLTVCAIPGLIAGFGLLARKTWARVLAIVVAILNLANIPVGTVIGLYTLWVLLQNSAGEYFAATPTGASLPPLPTSPTPPAPTSTVA